MTAAGAFCPRDWAIGEPVARVHCYKDHRVAMSHAVLGCVIRGVLVLDKECTDKTYPEFWDHAERLGVTLVPGCEAERGGGGGGGGGGESAGAAESAALAATFPAPTAPPPRDAATAAARASIVVVGMRCSGKSHLARAAARVLGWQCVDLDDALVAVSGLSCAEVIAARGWAGFRALEVAVLNAALRAHPFGAVLSCGGGIVETAPARAALATYAATAHGGARVVRLHRALADVDAELNSASECVSFMYRYISRESRSQFDSLPLTSLTSQTQRGGHCGTTEVYGRCHRAQRL